MRPPPNFIELINGRAVEIGAWESRKLFVSDNVSAGEVNVSESDWLAHCDMIGGLRIVKSGTVNAGEMHISATDVERFVTIS